VTVIGELLVLAGAVLAALSALGVNRLSPVLLRMHALTKAATGALVLALVGGMLALRTTSAVTSLLLALALQLFTFPVGANLVAHAVYARGDWEGREPGDVDDIVGPRDPPPLGEGLPREPS
jgi:multicomponent Na+:H+ antiporter subunit G